MRVFISWSGEASRRIAEELKAWLPRVLQGAKPFFSPADIEKGVRWANEIALELERSSIGLLCLTRENVKAPWMLFEAGAMSRALGSRVCPLLFGIESSEVSGPLGQFQAAPFGKEEMRKVLGTINGQLSDPMEVGTLDAVFEKWWPDLLNEINRIEAEHPVEHPRHRSTDEVLAEVLTNVRALAARIPEDKTRDLTRYHAITLFGLMKRLGEKTLATAKTADQIAQLEQLQTVLEVSREGFAIVFSVLDGLAVAKEMKVQANKLHSEIEKRIKEIDDHIPF